MKRPALGVFLILWASYAFFWHARDWNTASRLMLTYSLVDRGTIRIDGLEDQTGDRATFEGHSYSDKLPGYSFLAAIPYAAVRHLMGFPAHPLNVAGFAHWKADYAVTLITSGLATALAGALLTVLAGDLGCGPRRSALVGLAYGLATPAYAYATLAHGHQTSAACLLGAFALLWRPTCHTKSGHSQSSPSPLEGEGRVGGEPGAISRLRQQLYHAGLGPSFAGATPHPDPRPQGGRGPESDRRYVSLRSALAGFLAAYASVTELQVGPVSAILGLYALALVLGRRRPPSALLAFALGALVPTLFLLAYNTLAFGSPLRMGYFFHATQTFAEVHSASNPLGLQRPNWSRLDDLTIRPARGILWYAPILILAPPGLVALLARRFFGMAIVSAATVAAVFLVNLSYPEWSGGWSTGPRLLVPMLPFALLPVAGLLAVGGRFMTAMAAILAVAGAVVIFLFQGIGARVPNPVEGQPPAVFGRLSHPLTESVLPIWMGETLPSWVFDHRFARNLVAVARPGWAAGLPASWQWLQFAPLVVFQAATIGLLFRGLRRALPETVRSS